MKPSAYLLTWPGYYKPSVCLPDDVERYKADYDDVTATPLYTTTQIGEALMGCVPAQVREVKP